MVRTFLVTLICMLGAATVAMADSEGPPPAGARPNVATAGGVPDLVAARGGLLEPLERLTLLHARLQPAGSGAISPLDLDRASAVTAARGRADAVARRLRRNQALLGAVALAAGLFVAPSRNEWNPIDEGVLGLAGAAIGAGLLLDAAIPSRWRR